MKYYKQLIFILLYLLHFTFIYAAMIKGRKYSTAHYSSTGLIYILGGTESTSNSHFEYASNLLTLHFEKTDYSLHLAASDIEHSFLLPSIGHTSHLLNHSIITVFGLHPSYRDTPRIVLSSSNQTNHSQLSPSHRYKHTSILMDDRLYVIGGLSAKTHQPAHDVNWVYFLSNKTWTQLPTHTLVAGHVSISYEHWIISCFGQQQEELKLSNRCIWFDTDTFQSTIVTNHSPVEEWPTARSYASVVTLPNQFTHVLFGGENERDILDDLWQLDIRAPFQMTWTKLEHSRKGRSGHAGVLIDDLILYYGGQDGPESMVNEPIYFNTTSKRWITKEKPVFLYQRDVQDSASNDVQGISGGAIGGIIVCVIAIIAAGVGFFIWRRRKQQRHVHSESRAARFSQSPNNVSLQQLAYGEKIQMTNSMIFDNERKPTPFLSLPELAVTNSNNTRISAISLGAEFKFSTEDYYHRQSAQSSNLSRQQMEQDKTSLDKSPESSNKKLDTGTSGFKRLTLNLFSNSSSLHPDTDANQTLGDKRGQSGIFQLRGSRLLQARAPTTSDGNYPGMMYSNHSRQSLGGKSVSSVQWVGFNDTMDYKGNKWRDSSTSSLHLAVKNAANRASSHYTSDSTQSTPRSPMFPHHLRDSVAIQYHQENSSKQSIRS
ncbi:hypothetical protein RMATCC62417_01574 [Rhizopus microsporus]|nr:hypothetical protein RMATCC62417_01574 [Rhizopus microsporus]